LASSSLHAADADDPRFPSVKSLAKRPHRTLLDPFLALPDSA
jgi:hypothetical protein